MALELVGQHAVGDTGPYNNDRDDVNYMAKWYRAAIQNTRFHAICISISYHKVPFPYKMSVQSQLRSDLNFHPDLATGPERPSETCISTQERRCLWPPGQGRRGYLSTSQSQVNQSLGIQVTIQSCIEDVYTRQLTQPYAQILQHTTSADCLWCLLI